MDLLVVRDIAPPYMPLVGQPFVVALTHFRGIPPRPTFSPLHIELLSLGHTSSEYFLQPFCHASRGPSYNVNVEINRKDFVRASLSCGQSTMLVTLPGVSALPCCFLLQSVAGPAYTFTLIRETGALGKRTLSMDEVVYFDARKNECRPGDIQDLPRQHRESQRHPPVLRDSILSGNNSDTAVQPGYPSIRDRVRRGWDWYVSIFEAGILNVLDGRNLYVGGTGSLWCGWVVAINLLWARLCLFGWAEPRWVACTGRYPDHQDTRARGQCDGPDAGVECMASGDELDQSLQPTASTEDDAYMMGRSGRFGASASLAGGNLSQSTFICGVVLLLYLEMGMKSFRRVEW